MKITYPLRLHPQTGGFWAEFPDLPGCYTQGDTEEETLHMAKDALTGWLAVRFERNFKIPEPSRLKGKRIRWVEPEPEVAIPLLIRKIRQEKGMSQKVVAKRLGITYQTYQKWEKPEAANPTIKQLAKVASAIGRELVIEMM
jgi:antitoxin HicB